MSTERVRQIQEMFGRIVPRYDRLNRLMSLGRDQSWRREAVSVARAGGGRVLDVGTGTGDLAFELLRGRASSVVGVDFSPPMLGAAAGKAAQRPANLHWVQGDALRLPFPDDTFDAVTNAFVLRNLPELPSGLREMARVLKPGGRLVCLDMTHPRPGPIGTLYRLYFHHLMPPIAGLLSGDSAAYRYLPQSLEGYPDADALASMLREIGLTEVTVRRLGPGTVALHVARKAGPG